MGTDSTIEVTTVSRENIGEDKLRADETHEGEIAAVSHVRTPQKVNLRALDHDELVAFMAELGEPSFRAKQVEDWILKKNVRSFDDMTNLSKALRAKLSERASLGGVTLATKQESEDGTRKYLLKFADGVSVECVGMPSKDRLSVCVSTQACCAMGCLFCATGKSGFKRNLTPAEIYDQVAFVAEDFGHRATSVVLMGQGEPFANYDNTLEAMRLLNSPDGLGIGARHITVSTSGLVPQIRSFSHEPEQFCLAVSLHSARQELRNELMPGVRKHSLKRLHDAMADYVNRTKRRPTYEYAMIAGVNDTEEDLTALIDFTKGTLCHVNLIRLNELPGSRFKPSSEEKIERFKKVLTAYGVETTIRESRGNDIDAACGQLRQRRG